MIFLDLRNFLFVLPFSNLAYESRFSLGFDYYIAGDVRCSILFLYQTLLVKSIKTLLKRLIFKNDFSSKLYKFPD